MFHGSARATECSVEPYSNSQESIRALAGLYGINLKTVAKVKLRIVTNMDHRTICNDYFFGRGGAFARPAGNTQLASCPAARQATIQAIFSCVITQAQTRTCARVTCGTTKIKARSIYGAGFGWPPCGFAIDLFRILRVT